MGRTRSSNTDRFSADESDPLPGSPEAPEPKAAPEPTSAARATPDAPQKPRGREMTCSEFARGKGGLGGAFEVEVRLQNGRTIKHTREEWDQKFNEFMTRKR